MKYTILKEYKKYLRLSDLAKTTVDTYYNKMNQLLDGQNYITSGDDVDMVKVLDQLSAIKYKNYFSQSKNALFYFLSCFGLALTDEEVTLIDGLEEKTKKKYRKLKETNYKRINATIQRLKNKKLKLCFLVILETGLRVSELSQIKANDCFIFNERNEKNEKIQFNFIGKGGKAEIAYIDKEITPKLYQELESLIKNNDDPEKKLFYSMNYLQGKATKYGFTCHELRRISSKLEYQRTKSRQQVKEKLRHVKLKTTNRYLNSRIKMD